jgi:hypothetical protein
LGGGGEAGCTVAQCAAGLPPALRAGAVGGGRLGAGCGRRLWAHLGHAGVLGAQLPQHLGRLPDPARHLLRLPAAAAAARQHVGAEQLVLQSQARCLDARLERQPVRQRCHGAQQHRARVVRQVGQHGLHACQHRLLHRRARSGHRPPRVGQGLVRRQHLPGRHHARVVRHQLLPPGHERREPGRGRGRGCAAGPGRLQGPDDAGLGKFGHQLRGLQQGWGVGMGGRAAWEGGWEGGAGQSWCCCPGLAGAALP